jgi:hypothetical protein
MVQYIGSQAIATPPHPKNNNYAVSKRFFSLNPIFTAATTSNILDDNARREPGIEYLFI